MNEKLKRVAMNDDGFLFDPQKGISYITNSTGLEILRMLKKTDNIDEIKSKIVKEFDVSDQETERDLFDFLELLKSKEFVD